MWLKEFISQDTIYYPVDYKDRGDGTIICDFNNYEYPKIKSDIAFVSGCLEYITDYNWFVEQIGNFHRKCVISYCTYEMFQDIKDRRKKTWVNNLTSDDVVELFKKNNFLLKEKIDDLNTIFVFEK